MNRISIRHPLAIFISCIMVLFCVTTKISAQVTLTSINTVLGGSSLTATTEDSYVDVYGNIYALTASGATAIEIPVNGGPVVTIATGLSSALGIASDSLGNVYISQVSVATILKIALDGTTSKIGSGVQRPYLMAVDSSNNLYVTDSTVGDIAKISPGGAQTLLGFTGVTIPHGVAVDSAGNVYTASYASTTGTPLIVMMSPTGVQSTLPMTGLNDPYGLAVDLSGDLYVTDGTGKLYEFKPPFSSGSTPTTIASLGTSAARSVTISSRSDVIYNSTSKIYALQAGASNVYGTPVTSTSGIAALLFTFTAGKTLGAPVFLSNNSITAQFKDGGSSTCTSGKAIAAGGTCTLNVVFTPQQAGPFAGAVNLVDNATPTPNILATALLSGIGSAPVAAFAPGTQSTVLSFLGTPEGVALDAGGNLYVADATNDTVTKTIAGGVTTPVSFTGLTRPTGVAVDGAGSIYVSDASNNAVYKLTTSGMQTTVDATDLSAPKGIALDAQNNLYIADSGNQRIVKVDVLGNESVLGFKGLASPSFIAVDAVDDVFVSDTGKVYELPFAGTQVTLTPSGLGAAAGIAVDASDTLYVADSGNDNVVVSPVEGTSFTITSGLSSPAGLALSASGKLYIANTGAAQVVLLDRTAETLTFPSIASGSTSAAMTATVQNIGNTSLTTSGLSVSSGFEQVAPLAATDCSGSSTLTPTAICNVNINFSPIGLGSNSGTVTLTDNALNVNTSTQAISLVGSATRATAVALALTTPSSDNPTYGQKPTIMATVAPTSGTGVPTGSVTFALDGGTPSAPVSLTTGEATYSPVGLTAGAHTVVAIYSGDNSYAGSTSSTFTVTVAQAVLTVAATSQTRMYNVANAALAYTISGYQYSDGNSVVSGVSVLSTTATTTSNPGSYPISVTNGSLSAVNYSFTTVPGTITVTQATNTITFPAIANVTYGAFPITLGATSNSGLAVTYSVISGNATVTNGAGAAVTITGYGPVMIAANQAGNTDYSAASQVTQGFNVGKAVLTATANSLSKETGQANPALTYSLSGFVYADTSSVVSGAATLTTTAVTSSSTGTYPITIAQGSLSAANYTFALVNGTLTVTGATSQTITFNALPNITYGNRTITLNASASSGATVSYVVSGPATLNAATNVLSITGVGTVNIIASQAGNSTYTAATPVTQSFNVGAASLTVTTANASRFINTANPGFTYAITGYVNGDGPSVVSGAPSITTTATISSPTGSYPITTTIGTLMAANYTFAFTPATLTVNPASQIITFGAVSGVTYGAVPIALTATASSSLPVTYAVSGPATLNASNSTISITGVGTVSITASQAGNATYAAATPVVQSFGVAPAPLTVTASNASITYGAAIPTSFTYTITGFQYSDTRAVVNGAPSLTTTATSSSPGGTYPITPAVGSLTAGNYSFSNLVPGTLTISAAAQTISFAALSNIPQATSSLTLTATASSGLPVVYTETGTAPVTLSGNVLSISGPGTVSVTASQPGNSSFGAAIPVTQSFNVTATTATTLSLSTNTANAGASITLTAKVTFTTAGTPTGTVSFYDGTTLLIPTSAMLPSAVPLSVNGLTATAMLTTNTIPSGSTDITAVYTGDPSYTESSSNATANPILIVSPDFNITATPSMLTISVGQSGTSVITVTPVGGYSETITFSCPGIPSTLTCSFAPPALNFYPGTGTGTLSQTTTLTVTSTTDVAQLIHSGSDHETRLAGIFLGLPGLGFLLCFARRRRMNLGRILSLMVLVLVACGTLAGVSGCGSGSGTSTNGTYNIPVTLNDGSGITHIVTVTVNVQ
jgi:sugar lactone lactonase YvrE